MKLLEMPTLYTRLADNSIVIPGGWYARVPEVMPDNATLEAYARYFATDGYARPLAVKKAREVVQMSFEGGFVRGLKDSLRRWARLYAERFPRLRTSEGVLRGFNAAEMQAAFVPGENTGRAGKAFVNQMFTAMAREGERG